MVFLYDACDQISDFCHQQLQRKMRRKISWTDGRTEVKQYTPSPFGERGYNKRLQITESQNEGLDDGSHYNKKTGCMA